MDFWVIIFILIVIAAIVWVYLKNLEFVRNNGVCLKNLRELNKRQKFQMLNPVEKHHQRCNSKQQFDNFNNEKYILSIIDSNSDKYSQILNAIGYNKTEYNTYKIQYEYIINGNYQYGRLKNPILNAYLLKKLELTECEKERLKPPTEFIMEISVSYTSPRGRNRYLQKYRYNSADIKNFCDECNRIRQYKQSAQYQRATMTDKIRYQVLNRDKHRCVICGASAADGVKLHVDHILPVSKGGTNDLSNLRTLCDRCNLGKGASYNPNGYN